MKRTSVILVLATTLGIASTKGAERAPEPDFQFRIPLHLQIPLSNGTNWYSGFGLAGWSVFTDTTAENNHAQNLLLGGISYDYGTRGSWVELMGGSKLNRDGYNDPVADFRFLDKSLARINLSGELAYFPRRERERFYILLAADTPLTLGKYTPRIGIESEDIFSLSGKRDSLGIGPRLVLPIPWKIHPSVSASLTTAYQFRNDRDFVRCYFGLTYKFGKKK